VSKKVIRKVVCGMCNARCRQAVEVESNHAVSVEEDPDYPMQVWPPVKACVRRLAALEFMYNKNRLNYPLKRIGDRGGGRWQQVSWEDAFNDITRKLDVIRKENGAEAVGYTHGTARRVQQEFAIRFFNLFGSPNGIGQANICHGPRAIVGKAVFGSFPYLQVYKECRCSLIWGRAPKESFPGLWYRVREMKKQGVKIIYVDPRYTEEARMADIHLQPRPGTDCALVLSMIHIIISEGLYDKGFVSKWCYGFNQLKERAQEYPPEKVSEITWVPAEKIRSAARMYGTTSPAGLIPGVAIEQLENSAEFIHGMYILPGLTGNIDIPGGEYLPSPHPKAISENEMELSEMLPKVQKEKQLGGDQFRLSGWAGFDLITESQKRTWGKRFGMQYKECLANAPLLYRAIISGTPYPVRALITWGSNPMVTQANTKLVYEALKNLKLYVVLDMWMTPSAELADYVLPVASWLEKPCLWMMHGESDTILAGERAVPTTISGEYDRRDDYVIWRELGIRLGQKEFWPWESLEEAYDYRLAPLGCTFAEFMKKGGSDIPEREYRKYQKIGFATPTRKFELYSTILEKLGYDPLPAYREPSEGPFSQPELLKEYPLILITGKRHMPFYHSEFRQIDSLRNRHPDPMVQIHPETAGKLGIKESDWVWIETATGRVRQKCEFFAGMDPRIVSAQHGWWFPELPGEEPGIHGIWESNINVCINDDPGRCNPILGIWPLRTSLCKVYGCEAD